MLMRISAQVPIIFVVHSMGGLVFKKVTALCVAQNGLTRLILALMDVYI